MSALARKNTIIGNSQKNMDNEFSQTKVLKKQKTEAEMGSSPYQETDTGPGGMTSTGPKKRLGRAVARKNSKK